MLIVDTYNVLHAAGKVHEGLGGLTVGGLARLLRGSRWGGGGVGDRVVLVCDGTGGRSGVGDEFLHPDAPIRVVFAGPGKDADAAIERMVIESERSGKGGGRVTVVSSDKGVLASAIGPIGPKARRMTSEAFVRALVEDARRADGGNGTVGAAGCAGGDELLDADTVKRWVERFGLAGEAGPKPEPKKTPGSESRGTQEEWPPGINPDDLDMGKWLGEKK